MPNMTPQDAAMLKILRQKYGTSVYPSTKKTITPQAAKKIIDAKLAKKKK